MKRIMIAIAALAVGLAGCSSMGGGAAGGKSESGATVLAQGSHSSVKDQSAQDIHDQASFEKLWKDTFAEDKRPPQMPSVDFTKETVVAYYLGQMSHGGFDLRVQKAAPAADGNSFDVTFLVIKPGDGCPRTTQDTTYPFLIATVPTTSKTINFDVQQRANAACSS